MRRTWRAEEKPDGEADFEVSRLGKPRGGPQTVWRLPPRCAAVLINRAPAFTIPFVTVDAFRIECDGDRRAANGDAVPEPARAPDGTARRRGLDFFERLWLYDLVVLDASSVA
jgi:hypothetical protein